ncbi:hypothetical protein Mapa_015236 [Marchantia paleacea]|nr:hypothetical protein Mapa_015236 [Marchantia paleacea]
MKVAVLQQIAEHSYNLELVTRGMNPDHRLIPPLERLHILLRLDQSVHEVEVAHELVLRRAHQLERNEVLQNSLRVVVDLQLGQEQSGLDHPAPAPLPEQKLAPDLRAASDPDPRLPELRHRGHGGDPRIGRGHADRGRLRGSEGSSRRSHGRQLPVPGSPTSKNPAHQAPRSSRPAPGALDRPNGGHGGRAELAQRHVARRAVGARRDGQARLPSRSASRFHQALADRAAAGDVDGHGGVGVVARPGVGEHQLHLVHAVVHDHHVRYWQRRRAPARCAKRELELVVRPQWQSGRVVPPRGRCGLAVPTRAPVPVQFASFPVGQNLRHPVQPKRLALEVARRRGEWRQRWSGGRWQRRRRQHERRGGTLMVRLVVLLIGMRSRRRRLSPRRGRRWRRLKSRERA